MEIYQEQLNLLVWKDHTPQKIKATWYYRRLQEIKVIIGGAGKVGSNIAKHLVSQKMM